MTGTGVQVLGVTIQGGASAGIFVFGGSSVAIVGNTVEATLADGIHTTYGSTNVLVRGNTVKNTGDDLIAVVSYRGRPPQRQRADRREYGVGQLLGRASPWSAGGP